MSLREIALKLSLGIGDVSPINKALAGINDSMKAVGIQRAALGRFQGQTLGRALGGFMGPAAALGGAVGGAVGEVSGAISSMLTPFRAATSAIGSFVQAASPGTMLRFQYALDDVTGVIGQTLTPVIEALTPAVRLFGDFLASILPDANEMRELMGPVKDLFGDLRSVLAEIAPVIRDVLINAVRGLTVALQALMIPVKFLIGFFKGLFDWGEEEKKLRTSQGAHFRNVHFTDPLSAAKEVYAAAYRNSFGAGGEKQKTPLDKIGDSLNDAVGFLKDIARNAAEIGRTVGEWFKKTFGAVNEAADTGFGWINKLVGGEQMSKEEFWKTLTEKPGSVWDAIIHSRGSPFGERNEGLQLPSLRPDRDKAANRAAEITGNINRLLEGRTVQGDSFSLENLKRAFVAAMQEYGLSKEAAESQLDQVLRDANRRGMDGHH